MADLFQTCLIRALYSGLSTWQPFHLQFLNPSANLVLGAGGAGHQGATQCGRGDAGLAVSLLLHFVRSSSRSLDH